MHHTAVGVYIRRSRYAEVINRRINTPIALKELRHCIQIGTSGSHRDVVFELVAHEEPDIRTSLSHTFTKEGLLELLGYSRDMSTGDRRQEQVM